MEPFSTLTKTNSFFSLLFCCCPSGVCFTPASNIEDIHNTPKFHLFQISAAKKLFCEQGEFGVQFFFLGHAGGCPSAHQGQDVHVLLISAALSSPPVAAGPRAPSPPK